VPSSGLQDSGLPNSEPPNSESSLGPASTPTAAPTTPTDELDTLIGEWLTVPDAADELGVSVTVIRGMITDRPLAAVRRGCPPVLSIPARLVRPEPLASFAGTWTLLHDSGFDDVEALRWLFSTPPDEPAPIEELRAGRKTEVRRRVQALAF
jgi:hypothetical protein